MDSLEFEEARWLLEHPDFRMRPASIVEFVGEGYLNERNVRPGVMQALIDTFGREVNAYSISPAKRAVITGGIGIGKSTYAAIALAYMVHWVKCLRNPKEFFNLSEDSIIGFMMMSTNATLAREVIFQKVKKRIENSVWFKTWAKLANEKMEKQMRFEGDIWIVPGSSEETSFEGYDILGGIIDEGDSHKITERKSYAESGYTTIESRIESRFTDFKTGEHRGLIICIGQSKSKGGFMMTKYTEFLNDPFGVAVRMSIWESFGWHMYTEDQKDMERGIETSPRKSFYYDMRRREMMSKEAAKLIMNKDLIEVPLHYKKSFERDPVKALRDLAGIPPEVDDPFISQADRILDCQDLWALRYERGNPAGVASEIRKVVLPDWFRPVGDYRRVIHIDTAYSAAGDSLGFAMAHVPEKVFKYEEERPVIVFDMLMRIHANSAAEINFGEVREFIYRLRDVYGFVIDMVTIDGFNSIDFIQQLRKNRIKADLLSADKTKAPYEDLRETINDLRCLHPNYQVHYRSTDTQTLNIAYKELSELTDTGKKIDHPKEGSKDVADAMAGCAHNLISNSKYIREARTIENPDEPARIMTKDVRELLGFNENGDEIFAPASGPPTLTPVSFDDFQKQAVSGELMMPPSMNDLMRGTGLPGFPLRDERMW